MYAGDFYERGAICWIVSFFDELFQMVAMSVADPQTGAVSIRRGLRTVKDDKHTAKDRSGALASPWEVADLSVIFQKIMGATQ